MTGVKLKPYKHPDTADRATPLKMNIKYKTRQIQRAKSGANFGPVLFAGDESAGLAGPD
jgi:hypothetical protein